ncbi:hypothetical protein Dsin_005483 [Dipteronia sinensis]|uniref:Uncharacterized protein n=1 Tax=Dipteronia sinensis TaxID=43782 RepID=A0AAE0EER2_9ROSI|nr:hypothetical protein Dsin_005483 [Dipteronia sinensis]
MGMTMQGGRHEKLKDMLQKMEVKVTFSGAEGKQVDVKSESGHTPMKILPPWMIKQNMNLTKEQRREVKLESKMDGSSATGGFSDEKKSTVEDDKDRL